MYIRGRMFAFFWVQRKPTIQQCLYYAMPPVSAVIYLLYLLNSPGGED